jgi:hypothetical protein
LTLNFYSSVFLETLRKGGYIMYHPRFKGNHREIGLKYGGLLKKNNTDLFGLTKLDDFQFDYGIQSERVLIKFQLAMQKIY